MTQPFTDQLAQVGGPDWLLSKRQEGLALFNQLGVPTEQVEAWKYTRVDVDFDALQPHPKREVITDKAHLPASVQKRLSSTDAGAFLVFDGPDVVYRTELPAELTAKGWQIANVKTEDGCYEVYGKDDKGKRVEIFFDPATFEAVGSDD